MNTGFLTDLILKVQGTAPIEEVSLTVDEDYIQSFPELLSRILNVVLVIGVVAVLFYLVWGGLDWILSGGDKGKTESARNKITSAVVGLIILISAWAIMTFVQQLLGLEILKKNG